MRPITPAPPPGLSDFWLVFDRPVDAARRARKTERRVVGRTQARGGRTSLTKGPADGGPAVEPLSASQYLHHLRIGSDVPVSVPQGRLDVQ